MVIVMGWLVFEIIIFVLILWVSWAVYDKRYKGSRGDSGSDLSVYSGHLERTNEVFIDPKDGVKYRVYYNRSTGERVYMEEK